MSVERNQLPQRLHELADEQNDMRDHDELHAAGEVAWMHGTSQYVTRWIDGLLAAVPEQKQPNPPHAGGPGGDLASTTTMHLGGVGLGITIHSAVERALDVLRAAQGHEFEAQRVTFVFNGRTVEVSLADPSGIEAVRGYWAKDSAEDMS